MKIKELVERGDDQILLMLERDKGHIKMRLIYESWSRHVAHMAELGLKKYMDVLRQNIAFVRVLSDVVSFHEAIKKLREHPREYQALSFVLCIYDYSAWPD